MALCVAVFAGIAPRIEARAGAHRTVAAGMLLMVVGLVLFARLGLDAHYSSLLPGFMLFGAGAGLMNVPLTNAVMAATPTSVAGVASALLNASREVAGLLGITVIGAVLRTAQGASARGGADPVHAFLAGYHTSLLVTIGLMAALILRLKGIEVTAFGRTRVPYLNSDLLEAIGARYVSTQDVSLRDAAPLYGPFDLIYEATGFAPIVFEAMRTTARRTDPGRPHAGRGPFLRRPAGRQLGSRLPGRTRVRRTGAAAVDRGLRPGRVAGARHPPARARLRRGRHPGRRAGPAE